MRRKCYGNEKTGLGKGLDALFSTGPLEEDKEEEKVVEKVDESEKIHKIKITEIEPNKNQPRRTFNNESIEELSESIKRYGVIQPIIVTKKIIITKLLLVKEDGEHQKSWINRNALYNKRKRRKRK